MRYFALLSALSALLALSGTKADPGTVLWFDMDAAVQAESLAYEEQLVAFVFQGLVNEAGQELPAVMFNAGYMNFDWPGSDMYWRSWLTEQRRVSFENVTSSTLCGLVTNADRRQRIKGVVLYENDGVPSQAEWTLPIATTFASQHQLLPVTAGILAKHECLQRLHVGADLTTEPAMRDREHAWAWAFEKLLPGASKTVSFSLYHYEPSISTDPQSNATLANVDWAVQQKAFIMNFKTSGNPATTVNPLFSKALAGMDPLFSAYGWTDMEFGYVWMTGASGAAPDGTKNNSAAGGGGAVFCSFATPNLSFWKLLPLPDGRTKARPLPVYDRRMAYDKTKKYVLLETNEGDTPRIVVSAFSRAWTDPRRGSLPVSWSIDPALGEQFPALFDYFATTAGPNDSFISGPGGCGYVYYGNMTDPQIKSFATRCGRLMNEYGPAVIDTYGQTGNAANTVSVLSNFSSYAAAGGVKPLLYITQPTRNIHYAYYACNQSALDAWLPDGTPLLCTSSEGLFYVMGSLGGDKLAARINAVARQSGQQFITVYGGLRWTTTTGNTNATSLFTFWGDTIAHLDADVVPVGAQEMARLAHEARMAHTRS